MIGHLMKRIEILEKVMDRMIEEEKSSKKVIKNPILFINKPSKNTGEVIKVIKMKKT